MKTKFIKKALSILLSFTMVLPTLTQAFAASPSEFSDFPTGWSREAVTAAVANGLLNGRTPTTIEPTGNLTRAELATVINRAFGATRTADISSFTDVSPEDWFYTEIAKAVNMQTFQGDGTGTMRPNDPIKREEVFAVVARALVLETSDYSALSVHPDSGNISGWAKPYAAILSQKGYINGDERGNLNPQSNITREEFAQLLHNIIKTYYVGSGTYTKTGTDSSLIRTSGVILRNVTIDGDLIIGDGVGYGSVVFENVIIKGRLLCRGGENSVRLVNTKVGEGIVVKDVNGVVHFDNYKSEDAFKNIIEITKSTYKGDNYSISMGGSGGSGTTSYTVTISGAGCDKTVNVNAGENYVLPTPNMTTYAGFAGWKLQDGTVKNAGDTVTVNSSLNIVAVYKYKIEHYFETYQGSGSYVINDSKTQNKKTVLNASVTAFPLIAGIEGYVYNASHPQAVTQGFVSKDGSLVLKLYYNSTVPQGTTFTVTLTGAGFDINTSVPVGTNYTLPTPDAVQYSNFFGWENTDTGSVYAAGGSIPITSNSSFVAVFLYRTNHYVETAAGSGIYTYLRGIVEHAELGTGVTAQPLTQGIDGYEYYPGHPEEVTGGTVSATECVAMKLYYRKIPTAIPADYTIEYYQLEVGGVPSDASDYVCTSSATISGNNVGDSVRVIPPYLTGFTYNPDPNLSKSSGTVLEGNALVLKLYYTRNTINIFYDFSNGGSFIPGYTPAVTSTPYGTTITLPTSDKVQNGYNVFLGWSFNGNLYSGGETVTIVDFDPQNGWEFVAVWETTPLFTVKFWSQGYPVAEHTLPQNTSVPQSVFDSLSLSEQAGYVENANVSPVYAGNEYTHKVKFGWYYNPSSNTWQKFTSSTLVTEDIVDSSGILTVVERSPQFSIYAYVDKLDLGFTFARYYEPTVVTVDGSGNETITGTRAMDTFKNFLWDSFSDSFTPLQTSLQEQIAKGGDKAFAKLQEKGIIDANKNILPLEVFVRFSQIIGEEELEEYIVDNAKDSLSDNNELKDAIFEYFENMANSLNPDDVSEVKSLFKEAIDRAIGSDAGALSMVRDICESKLNDASLIKTALKDFVDYDVDVTDADLTADATETIIKWTKDLIDTDPTFKANVKSRLVKYITDNLVNSAGFFEEVVAYNFAGTPFDHISYPSSGQTTAEMVISIVKNEFESMSADEIAEELGYADLDALFVARKADILDVLIDDLNDAVFFEHVISTTDFKDYDYDQIKNATTLSIIVDFINKSIDDMTSDELADFGGFINSAAMIDEAKDKFVQKLASDIRDTSKSSYEDVVVDITGLTAVPTDLTSKDLFKEILKKVVSDAKTNGDYEILEALTGEDFSAMNNSEITSFFDNFEDYLENDLILDEYLMEATLGKYTLNILTNPSASMIPATARELLARLVEIRFEDDADLTLELLGITDSQIIEKTKEYAKEKAADKVFDSGDTFLVEQIEDHLGIRYASYSAVPANAFDLVIDVVEDKVNTATGFNDSFAAELGYTNMDSLFDEIKQVIIDDVSTKISTDENELKHYVEKYTHKTFDTIAPVAIDFIVQYAKSVLEPMTYDEIKTELISFGMTEDEIDEHIGSYIRDNIIDVVTDEFGYCPSNISNMNTKEFIVDVVLYFFDNDENKRDAIINKAIDYLVDGGDLSDFEEYVDHAIDHLRESGQLDTIIDEIIESRYRDVLDTMIHQLVNEDEFEITSANGFILTAFEMQVKDYTFDDLISKVPEEALRLYPRAKLEAIYNRAYTELLLDIEEGKTANANGQSAFISTGLNFIINLVDDVYVVFRDRFVELLDEKATRNYYYRENQYLRELVRLTSVESIFDIGTGVGTGYAFKDYNDYYDLLVAMALVGDDALKWYTEELTSQQFDQLVLGYEDLFVKYASLIADMVGDYAEDGTLPDRLNNNIVKTIETKIREKLGDHLDKILNWYKNSAFNRDYNADDYAKLRKVVNKAFRNINITTDEVYNLIGRGYNLMVNKFDGISSIERVVQIDSDTYEITIMGKTIRVERISGDAYTLTVQGKSITVARKDDGNTYEIIAGGNKVIISRAIVE